MIPFIIFIIGVALVFDFLNGFHDAANSIATVVSTRVLKPYWAVAWAAFFNFIAFLFFKLEVASTIGTGLISPDIVNPHTICAALFGAITWNILTWYYGLPSSSSHALIGGLLGAGFVQAKGNLAVFNFAGISKVIVSIFLSPLLGFLMGGLLMFLVIRLFWRVPRLKADKIFRRLQLFSAALISLGHGGNDAQKTMGIIALLLFSSNLINTFYVPLWLVITCNFVMALGTLFGGWKIVRTMGMRITKLKPASGFCAESASALTLFLATSLGIPVSTTHTIVGSIFGAGSLYNNFSAVRWGIAKRIVWAWIVTVPAAALVAIVMWWVIRLFIPE